MRRRDFITLLGGVAAAWPLAVRAQPSDRVRRLAAMMGGRNADTDPDGRAWFSAFRQGLQDLGWVEGHNFRADYRWPAGDLDRMRVIAKEFIDLQPDVLVAGNTPAVVSLLRETRTIPIVFTLLSDPVGTGVVASLARPGGNATGFTAFEYSLAGKWLEILKDLAPAVTRVALLFNPETSPYAKHYLSFIETAAPAFKVVVTSASIRSISEMEAALTAHAREPGGGLVVLPDAFTFSNRSPLISAAARHHLPAIYALRGQAADGGLVSYGPDTVDLWRRAAAYVDRILRGANPAELPVQQPTRYELLINLKTAKALGLTVPPTLLARADEVIE
jgi:putative tryptophan/tyrosine transport system substrate-binding protein